MHNGTLISDLQSLVNKFGSGGRHADGGVGRPNISAAPVSSQSDPLPIQSYAVEIPLALGDGHSGLHIDCFGWKGMQVMKKLETTTAAPGHTSTEDVRNCIEGTCHCDARKWHAAPSVSPDLSSASPSAGEGYLDRICNNCGQPHGKHSHIDDACPEPYLVGPMYSTTEFFDSGKRCEMCGQAEEDHGNGWRCL